MARGPVRPGALGTKEQQQAARAAAIDTIVEQLQHGPKTAGELLDVVGCLRATLSNYLNHMHKTLRLIHMTGTYRNRGELWALGADTKLPSHDEALDQLFEVRRGTSPARQIGMRRDPMVAALFGSARGAAC